EVWYPNETFGDLATIILNNLNMYGDSLKTVLAAYVNHDLSEYPGFFNTPAVLLANSVIFSFGGSHVELGEHMLGHEYFPNDNLVMNQDLEQQLFNYYDFLVAYENLLRDHGKYSQSGLSTSGSIMIGDWPPQLGSVASFKKETGSTNVYHLINFINATTLDWRDNEGTQAEPILIEYIPLEFDSEQEVSSIWIASPDINACSPMELEFAQENSRVFLTVPMLKYWDIIVVKYDSVSSIHEESVENLNSDYYLYQNYPDPFNPLTTIRYQIPHSGFVTLKVYDILGKEIATLVHEEKTSGRYEVNFNASSFVSGVYLYRLSVNDYVDVKKMLLIK
ncbi:MAG: T9SS type A sorting domain-containing protein, partial [Cyclobacteriaceae bacterium]|nr:T9SS type A sorting domain-containing protein [Cyclobacteriaceae bacterium]